MTESPGGLVKLQVARFPSQSFCFLRSGVEPEDLHFNEDPDAAILMSARMTHFDEYLAASGPRTTL